MLTGSSICVNEADMQYNLHKCRVPRVVIAFQAYTALLYYFAIGRHMSRFGIMFRTAWIKSTVKRSSMVDKPMRKTIWKWLHNFWWQHWTLWKVDWYDLCRTANWWLFVVRTFGPSFYCTYSALGLIYYIHDIVIAQRRQLHNSCVTCARNTIEGAVLPQRHLVEYPCGISIDVHAIPYEILRALNIWKCPTHWFASCSTETS